MSVVKRFEELDVWLAAKDMSVMIYKITENETLRKDFGLKD
jgi:hypothetical protein